MHLPEMRLPAFDGKFENWNAFYNTFNSAIDKNACLTTLQKFHYLRASLVGAAANCVNSLVFHEENYPKALSLLKQRCDCPRRIVSCHSLAIINYPKLTQCSPMALRDLANVVRQNLDALTSLGQSIEANSILLDLISTKLPDHIRQQWELTLTNKKVPQYTDLLDYLENLALTGISPSEVKQIKLPDQPKRVRQRKIRGQTFTASQVKNSCHSCKGQHSIWHCDAFRAKSVSERLREVKSALLCLNCLSAGHTTRDCHAGSCRVCGGRHHTMLHQDRQRVRSTSSNSNRSSSPSSRRSSTSPSKTRKAAKKHKKCIDRYWYAQKIGNINKFCGATPTVKSTPINLISWRLGYQPLHTWPYGVSNNWQTTRDTNSRERHWYYSTIST